MIDKPLLEVKNLKIQIKGKEVIQPVSGVNFTIRQGEIFTLVGESGCGKTVTTLAINRLLPENAFICEGSEIVLQGQALHQLSESEMRKIRGAKIAMIFQDPSLALNPVLTIGDQLREGLKQAFPKCNKKALNEKARVLLKKVKITDPLWCLSRYPHQLSGGMRQRIMIAMALSESPDLLIADEPTTALDVTTQAQVLALIKELNQKLNMAILLITHDLGIVAQMADTVGVMYAGHIVEQAKKEDFFKEQKHPYSKKLFEALPENTSSSHPLAIIKGEVPPLNQVFHLCRFKERCQYVFKPCEEIKPQLVQANGNLVRCHWYDDSILSTLPKTLRLQNIIFEEKKKIDKEEIYSEITAEEQILKVDNLKVYYPIHKGILKRVVGYVKAVDDISFDLLEGQTLGIVGESGCGKTTLGKALMRLLPIKSGKILFENRDLIKLNKKQLHKVRSDIQMIFQDPAQAMDPHMDIEEIIEEGMLALKVGTDKAEREDRIHHLLQQVGLNPELKSRYPHELSGGQKQRVAIARALAVGAKLIVCDEPTSALDVSVQAQIINLLKSLQEELAISYIFITHNISVVHYLADKIAVMYQGKIVEYGEAKKILSSPSHEYTKALLKAVPSVSLAHNENVRSLEAFPLQDRA